MNAQVPRVAVGRRLLQQCCLPIAELHQRASWLIDDHLSASIGPVLSGLSRELIDAVVHEYFVDAEGRALAALMQLYSIPNELLQDLRYRLHLLISATTGPLMPSYQYRYEIRGDELYLTPTLPTIEDHERRIEELADPDEGWVSSRHRR